MSAEAALRMRRRRLGLVVLVVVLAVVAFVAWRLLAPRGSTGVISLSGRVDGDESAIAPKLGGRILAVRVREGDQVSAGEIIATLDDAQLRAQEDRAQASVADAQARAQAADEQVNILRAQLQQAVLQQQQAQIDADGRVREAEANYTAAQADYAQQQAAYRLALFDKNANEQLWRSGAISERDARQSESTADQLAAVVAAERRRIGSARGALTVARANLANPSIRASATSAIESELAQQTSVIASATSQINEARAELAEAQANRTDLTVRAPFAGTVMTRAAEPGEVVTAGTPIITLLDLHKLYLRGFVPEEQIGEIKVGQHARVYLDSNPNQPIDAYVLRIDPQATFTPENTYFREDRVKQVFGVKLAILGAIGYAKPGMPADGEILVEGDAWPKAGRMQ